ncbi:uncharacterized protein LOC129773135 [Toxorhynchites rutilus septentrionalis]|uniref:uncharacterized protein LOC129773135 n=1 Tax=Toxorhynchites rutilus septentrionalis TaxID=329112 RepID=UPI00247A542D|nr:uncharacterized protein LOC129773135 [Toxorhynchites rutilus septentrionalis]
MEVKTKRTNISDRDSNGKCHLSARYHRIVTSFKMYSKVRGSYFLTEIIVLIFFASSCSCYSNLTEFTNEVHHRDKRFVSFVVGGGVAKIVLGGVFPVFFHHKLKRSLNAALNLQANYAIPARIVWPVPEHVFKQRLSDAYVDNSRPQLYNVLERMIDSWGRNGRACLLRTICEVAETPLSHNGMFGEILDVIFTPTETDVMDSDYKLARKYGMHGVKCAGVYSKCLLGHGFLDAISTVNVMS